MNEFLQNITFLHVVALSLVIAYMGVTIFGKHSLKIYYKLV